VAQSCRNQWNSGGSLSLRLQSKKVERYASWFDVCDFGVVNTHDTMDLSGFGCLSRTLHLAMVLRVRMLN
jgi:hypothetical protein